MKAAAFLDEQGYSVANLDGGQLAWADEDA